MSEEANKKIVLDYVEAFNRGDLAALRRIFSDDAEVQGVLGWGGMDVVVPIWEMLHAAFNIQLTVEALIAEGDTVAVRYLESGTFNQPFREHPPTGKSFAVVALEWFIIKDGRIHRRWGARDSAAQFRQVGIPLS